MHPFMLSVATLALAVPTAATAQRLQGVAPPPPRSGGVVTGNTVSSPTAGVRDDIRDGRRSGQLSRRTARGLYRDAARIDAVAERRSAQGVTEVERDGIRAQVEGLNGLVVARRTRGMMDGQPR